MDFNFGSLKLLKPKPGISEDFGFRLGNTKGAYNISFSSSDFNDVCWWTLEAQSASIMQNDSTAVHSDVTSYIAGTVTAIQSVIGVILNLLLIIALLKNSKLRTQYLTKAIVSILVTDLIWCVSILPMFSLRFFAR